MILRLLTFIIQWFILLFLNLYLLIELLLDPSCLNGLFVQCLLWQPPRTNNWIRVQLNEHCWVKSRLKLWESIFVNGKKYIVLL